MGKILTTLARSNVPRGSIFGERFVVECCERFHVHVRNLRLDLSPDDWRRLLTAVEEAGTAWRAAGEPDQHPHLELGRAKLPSANASDELSIELCENLYKQWPTGWDSSFHHDDSFVHFHWRDMRVEMSNAEFLHVADQVRAAATTLRGKVLEPLSALFARLDDAGILYAVMRNWEKLPDQAEVGAHSDLDLLVHPDHVDRLDEVLGAEPTMNLPYRVQRKIDCLGPEGPSFVLADVRSPGDGYFPDALSHRMLARRVRHRGFWVLHPEDHLLGIAYHVIHHKGISTADYSLKMKLLARRLGIAGPARTDDWAYAVDLLRAHGIDAVEALDETVRPFLPYVAAPERVVSSKFLAVVDDVPIISRVYRVGHGEDRRIRKQATATFVRHEHDVLRALDDVTGVPRVDAYEAADDGSHASFTMHVVDGATLDAAGDLIRSWRADDAARFVDETLALFAELGRRGVVHRDVRAANLMVADGRPVLIDFGWATMPGHELSAPAGDDLGGEARVPEGDFCDAYSLGYVLAHHVSAVFPELTPISDALLAARAGSPPDWAELREQLAVLGDGLPDDPMARFDRLMSLGRNIEASEHFLADQDGTDAGAFWARHLGRLGLSGVSDPADAPAETPASLRESPAVGARVLAEALGSDPEAVPGWVGEWLTDVLTTPDGGPLPPVLLDLLDAHHARLRGHVDTDALREAYRAGGRLDRWILREGTALLDAGDAGALAAFVRWAESEKIEPGPAAAEVLARAAWGANLVRLAESLAGFVLEHDPYAVECARIRAGRHAAADALEDACAELDRVCILDEDDGESRRQRLEIRHRIRHARRPAPSTPESLPDEPTRLLAMTREMVNAGRHETALAAARKLVASAPEYAAAGEAMIASLETLARNDPTGDGGVRILLDPLDERSYRETPSMMLQQLAELLQSPLGQHPVIHAEFVRLLRERGASAEQIEAAERQLATLAESDPAPAGAASRVA